MESPNSEQLAGLKRKRSPVPGGAEEGRPVPSAGATAGGAKGSGNVTQINYLVRAKSERLGLIEGDGETFGDVLGMIDDYEGMFDHGTLGLASGFAVFERETRAVIPSFWFYFLGKGRAMGPLFVYADFSRRPSKTRKSGCESRRKTRWSPSPEILREVIRWPYQGHLTIFRS